jgi:hypothetical protein
MLSSHSHQSPLFVRCNQRIGFQGLATLGWTQQVVVFCHFCMNGPKYWPANITKLRNFQHKKFGASDRTISSIYYRANCTAQSKRQPVPACTRHQVVDCFSSGEKIKMCYNVESHIYTYLHSEKSSFVTPRYNKERKMSL